MKCENYEEAKEKKEQIAQLRDEMAKKTDLDLLFSTDSKSQNYSRTSIVSLDLS